MCKSGGLLLRECTVGGDLVSYVNTLNTAIANLPEPHRHAVRTAIANVLTCCGQMVAAENVQPYYPPPGWNYDHLEPFPLPERFDLGGSD